MNYTDSMPSEEFRTLPFEWSWRGVLRVAAVVELALLLVTMVALRDLLAAGLAVILLAGLALLFFRTRLLGFEILAALRVLLWRLPIERLGALLLAFLFADIGFYTLTGAASNLLNGIYGAAVYLPATLAAVSLVGFVAAAICVLNPHAGYARTHVTVNFVGFVGVVWVMVMLVGLLGGQPTARVLPPSDIQLVTENMAYSKTALNARHGQVIVQLENHDLFWHTFTVPELGVDLKVPVQATQQVKFEAPAGTYRFLCTVPGHEMLGMEGTLVVRGE